MVSTKPYLNLPDQAKRRQKGKDRVYLQKRTNWVIFTEAYLFMLHISVPVSRNEIIIYLKLFYFISPSLFFFLN